MSQRFYSDPWLGLCVSHISRSLCAAPRLALLFFRDSTKALRSSTIRSACFRRFYTSSRQICTCACVWLWIWRGLCATLLLVLFCVVVNFTNALGSSETGPVWFQLFERFSCSRRLGDGTQLCDCSCVFSEVIQKPYATLLLVLCFS
jgi:hypothetical protein